MIAPPCVVVEIRDREDNEFSLADIEMMVENREAHAAVVIAAHAGSLPKQYADRAFAISHPKRLITLVLDPESPEAEVVLSAAYHLACVLAVGAVRQSRDGDWEAVARKVEALEQLVEDSAEDLAAFGQIERKAHDAATKSSRRHVPRFWCAPSHARSSARRPDRSRRGDDPQTSAQDDWRSARM